jgi:DNA-binding NarL/FixJ family response regulator
VAQILLVDHNPQIRRLLKMLIEAQAGWHICGEAVDGQEAVDKATELKPDLIVLDFSMPILNGFQVAAKISETDPAVPMILFTIHVFPAMTAEAKKVGIREVVGKGDGAAAARLLEVIETLLRERPAAAVSGLNTSSQPERTDAETEKSKERPPEVN